MELNEINKTYGFVPPYKKCSKCAQIIFAKVFKYQEVYFFCPSCKVQTKWNYNTIISKMQISSEHLNHLITMFLNRRSPSEANEILKYDFVNLSLNKKTIDHYFSIFNRIVMEYYLQELDSVVFEGELELDESHLFKEKASFAPHRLYSNHAVWLFGICQRKSNKFIIFPISNRQEQNLKKIIFKFIKAGSTIYTDCFSSYVNNHVFPRKSKLSNYSYIHFFIIHKKEFVSQLFKHIHTNKIESLWKQVKQQIRRERITTFYIPAIARFYFFRTLHYNDQKKLIENGLLSNQLGEFEDLIKIILNKF